MKRNSQGFSLLGVLVGVSIFTVAMSALADMMVAAAKSQRDIKTNSELTMIADRVKKALDAEWSCTEALKNQSYTGAIEVRDPVLSTVLIAHEGKVEGKIWTMEKVRLEGLTSVQGQVGIMKGSLVIETKKNMKVSVGAPVITRRIEDIYFEQSGGKITRCYGPSGTLLAAQSTCEMLGGSWFAQNEHGERCKLNGNSNNANSDSNDSGDDDNGNGNGKS